MDVFANEKEMQKWLETKFEVIEGLSEIIYNTDDVKDYVTKNLSEEKIKETFLYCLESLSMNELLTKNENISSKKGDSLNPDIFAYAPETQSLVIIELKNSSGATREAGTELSAYAGEIKSALSYLSDGEVINVIISPAWPALLKHHLYNNIFWQGKNTICLEPFMLDGDVWLKVIDISVLVQADIPSHFSEEHLGGYHICLYDHSQYEVPRPISKLHKNLKLMEASISAIATKGEKMGSHGFAFLSRGTILAPYFITVVNAAPFKSIERILHSSDVHSYSDLPLIERKILDIYFEHSPEGHGSGINSLYDTARSLLKRICSPAPESFTAWSYLKEHILKEGNPLYFDSWGVFKDLAIKKLICKYESNQCEMNLNSANLGLEVLEEIIDKDYQYINPHYLLGSFFPKDHPRYEEDVEDDDDFKCFF